MTQATEPETIELAIVSCETCDQLFLVSPRRETCPTCGGPAGLTFFEFVGDQSGVHLKDGVLAAPVAPAHPEPVEGPAPEPAVAVAAQEEEEDETSATASDWEILLEGTLGFLGGGGLHQVDIETWLLGMGVDPETAATAVGRLTAVRDLFASLQAAAELVKEEEDGSAFEPATAAEELPPAEAPPPEAPQPPQDEEEHAGGPVGSTDTPLP